MDTVASYVVCAWRHLQEGPTLLDVWHHSPLYNGLHFQGRAHRRLRLQRLMVFNL